MDLLASLNLDILPEQQTRISDNRVRKCLKANPDTKLGFNACCNCGSPNTSITCKGCKRVSYCSEKCRAEDANPPPPTSDAEEKEEEEIPEAMGHSSIICALLRLCDEDEDADDRRRKSNDKKKKTTSVAAAAWKSVVKFAMGESKEEKADDRVRSELESYPATLANIITDGPCYKEALASRRKRELVVHVIGASLEAELWWDFEEAADAYAEALTDFTSMGKFSAVRLIFVGPECPKENVKEERVMESGMDYEVDGDDRKVASRGQKKQKRQTPRLVLQTFRENYDVSFLKEGLGASLPADIVVFFNPGFTCPDYDWVKTLSLIRPGTPFLVTTNTEMEGISDVQYLHERGWMRDLPPGIADFIQEEKDNDAQKKESKDGENCASFFSENPYAGSRVRQSGTMANDLFVKNRWIFGGIFGQPTKKTSKRKYTSGRDDGESRMGAENEEHVPLPKKHKKKGKGNSKKSNPALI